MQMYKKNSLSVDARHFGHVPQVHYMTTYQPFQLISRTVFHKLRMSNLVWLQYRQTTINIIIKNTTYMTISEASFE